MSFIADAQKRLESRNNAELKQFIRNLLYTIPYETLVFNVRLKMTGSQLSLRHVVKLN